MKTSLRKRTSELIVSAIISGGFTSNEIEEITTAFEQGDYSFRNLGSLIRDIARRLEFDQVHERQFPKYNVEPSNLTLADIAYAVVRRRRLSRDEVLKLVQRVDPHIYSLLRRREGSVINLLVTFFDLASRSTAEGLLNLLDAANLESSSLKDPYLEAITKRGGS
jgi:hypothetical protein